LTGDELARALSWAREAKSSARPPLDAYDPAATAGATLDAYRAFRSARASSTRASQENASA
jgi:hypothetical protein